MSRLLPLISTSLMFTVISCNSPEESTLASDDQNSASIFISTNVPTGSASNLATNTMQALDTTADFIRENIKLTKQISVSLEECRGRMDHYQSLNNAILLCIERVSDFATVASTQNHDPAASVFSSTVSFYFLHELAHALINNLPLEHVGKEEDAADQLSALLLTEMYGAKATVEASYQFEKELLSGQYNRDYSAPHSLSPQRYFNLLCWAHGDSEGALAGNGLKINLPAARHQSCLIETRRNRASWMKKLAQHMRSGHFISTTKNFLLTKNDK